MSNTFDRIRELVADRHIRISDHGYYDETADENIFIRDILTGVSDARVVEDYPTYHKGACVLVLQQDEQGKPIHVVWGIPKDAASPAVIVTAYRPTAERWSDDFMTRHHRTKPIHEGQYAAEVDVELIDAEEGWAPYLSLGDAQKLDEIRLALRGKDLKRASQLARVFQLTPVSV